MNMGIDYKAMLDVAIEEARVGLAEGGIPIGAALFDRNGVLLGQGHGSSYMNFSADLTLKTPNRDKTRDQVLFLA